MLALETAAIYFGTFVVIGYVAKRLSWYFSPHQKRDREVEVD